MLESLISLLNGGVFGLVGGLFKRFLISYYETKKQELDYSFQIDLAKQESINTVNEIKLQTALQQQQIDAMEAGAKEAAAEEAAAEEAARAGAFADAIRSEVRVAGQNVEVSQWVVNLRASLRPILTYLLILASIGFTLIIINFELSEDAGAMTFINAIFHLTGIAVGFWFGDRPKPK